MNYDLTMSMILLALTPYHKIVMVAKIMIEMSEQSHRGGVLMTKRMSTTICHQYMTQMQPLN